MRGKAVTILFYEASTRTRVSFEVGIRETIEYFRAQKEQLEAFARS